MACGPAMDQLQDLAKYSAPQVEDSSDNGVSNPLSSLKKWNKPVKLNLALIQQGGALLPQSARVTRQLFTTGRNVTKDIQNNTAARKTLAFLPRNRPSLSIRRLPDAYKAPLGQPRNPVNRNKPNVGQAHLNNRRDSKMYQRKTLGPPINMSNISERSTNNKVSKIPAKRSQNHSSMVTSQLSKIDEKVKRHGPRLDNLENSVNLLNVDDVEEKILKESSLLKSQVIKQTFKNTGGDSTYDARNEERILSEQTAINEKLKHVDEKLRNINEKLDKSLFELADLKEIIKNLASNQETGCSCSLHCQNSRKIVVKSTAANNSEHTGSEAVSDEQPSVIKDSDNCVQVSDNCVQDSASTSYSVRRSLRLNNKGAQYAYESLRKSTKLLTTPRPGSTKKTNTPGRISRKVIAQLNELYND